MPGMAVIIFSFPEPGPGEDLKFPLLIEKTKAIFEGVKDVRIHAGIRDAADEVIAIFDPPEEEIQEENLENSRGDISENKGENNG